MGIITRRFGFCGSVLFISLLCLAGGCVTTTKPVLLDDQVISDNSIVGKWVADDGKSKATIAAADNKSYSLEYVDENNKKGTFTARLGKIDTMLVLELQPVDPVPDATDVYKAHLLPLFSFMLIEKKSPDQFTVRILKSGWLKTYLTAHPGELATADVSEDRIIVTASAKDFQAFLIRHAADEGALTDPAPFLRSK